MTDILINPADRSRGFVAVAYVAESRTFSGAFSGSLAKSLRLALSGCSRRSFPCKESRF
jgi:hypothetical protein